MKLKAKLYLIASFLHLSILVLVLSLHSELGEMLLLIELFLLLSFSAFIWLIHKATQPLDYVHTFSSMLKEKEFSSRFSSINQNEIDELISSFNEMLQRLYEERLRLGEQRGVFLQLMEESPIGVLLLDYEDKISDLNPSAVTLIHIKKEDAIGRRFSQFNHPFLHFIQTIPIEETRLYTTESGAKIKVGHFQIRDRGFHRSFFTLSEMTGDVLHAQKQAYEKLIRLMSHEVNNTIAITSSLLESVRSEVEKNLQHSNDDYLNAIDIVIQRSQSLNRFMKGYADVIKLPHPVMTRFNLSKQLKDLGTLFFAECQQKDIAMELKVADNIYINADPHLMEQALVNILKNSIEAIEGRGEIIVELLTSEEKLILRIIDSGYGLNNEIKHQLFTPFFTTKDSGQGLGLMLIDEIFRQHQFQYSLQNREHEQGAVFAVALPKL